MRLNLFGINILPVAEYDYFFPAAGEEQVAVRVEVAEIASVEPSVAQHRCSGIRTVPVALHHDRAAQSDFTCGWTVLVRLRVGGRVNDFGLDALHGLAHRSDHVIRWRIRKH